IDGVVTFRKSDRTYVSVLPAV
ncbi:MAG: hypothetical protein V4492_06045, partial [Chlamydiota bacterium]